jgi:hypothetical protein
MFGVLMPVPRLDVLCIGNANVAVIADAGHDYLDRKCVVRGSMFLSWV